MKRFIALLIMATMVLSTAGAASAVSIVYEICGTTNPDATGNVADIANSGVAFTAIGAVYPDAVATSGNEALITDTIKAQGGTWVVLIGGPVANSLTKELVDAGKVSANLNGYVKVPNAWTAMGANAMVIFGPERADTQAACSQYAADLRAGVTAAQLTTGTTPLSKSFVTESEVWQTELQGADLEADADGWVWSTDGEVDIMTEGKVKTNGANGITVDDMEQQSGEPQKIKYGGDLTVRSTDYVAQGTLTGEFTGSTGFGAMQNGVVTQKVQDWTPVTKGIYNIVLQGTGAVTGIQIFIDDNQLIPGVATPITGTVVDNTILPPNTDPLAPGVGDYAFITLLPNNQIYVDIQHTGTVTPAVTFDCIVPLGTNVRVPDTAGNDWLTSGAVTNEISIIPWAGLEFRGTIAGDIAG